MSLWWERQGAPTRRDVIAHVHCPTCGVAAGHSCVSTRSSQPMWYAHLARYHRYRRLQRLQGHHDVD